MDRSAIPDLGYAAKYEAVIALRKYAGQAGSESVGGHHTARPWRIPKKENR